MSLPRVSASVGMSATEVTDKVSQANPIEPPRSIQRRRAERELFFWTARQALQLILFAAFVIYVVVAMIEGRVPIPSPNVAGHVLNTPIS
jgi:hypothetical protein